MKKNEGMVGKTFSFLINFKRKLMALKCRIINGIIYILNPISRYLFEYKYIFICIQNAHIYTHTLNVHYIVKGDRVLL